MKILLIGNYEPDRQESMQRFADVLQRQFLERGHEVRLLQPQVNWGRLAKHFRLLAKWLGYIDKLLVFPRVLKRELVWADVVHICDHSNATCVPAVISRPVIVTCHDMLAVRSAVGDIPENRTRWSGRIYQRIILAGLRRAPAIACVSKKTRDDVLSLLGEGERLVTVVYNGLNYPYSPVDKATAETRLARFGLRPDSSYLMHVGGNQWYKNRPGVLRIFQEIGKLSKKSGLQMVMVGKPMDAEMLAFIAMHHIEEVVIQITDADNEDLRALYTYADGLLFPSLQEGFGWPIIEAQACGCRVFTSNWPPMNEIGGPGAIYIDSENPGEAAKLVAADLDTPDSGKELRLNHAAEYSTDRMIEGYLEIYREAIAHNDPAVR